LIVTIDRDNPDLAARLRSFFQDRSRVELAYLFGSAARGTTGPLSDVDVAIRFSTDEGRTLDERLKLHDALCRYLGSDRVDLVDLDDASPVLRYNVMMVSCSRVTTTCACLSRSGPCPSTSIHMPCARRTMRCFGPPVPDGHDRQNGLCRNCTGCTRDW
jgi:predicted nucleotidyltransferase